VQANHIAVGLLAFGLVTGFATTGSAQAFRPFDDVTSTCATCTCKLCDKLTLKDGKVVEAVVVAENPMFYVLAKYGEWRAVGVDQVAKLERNPNAERGTGHTDQLLAKDGLVVSGVLISDNAATGYVEFASVGVTAHMKILKSMVEAIYKAGKLYYTAK